MGVGCGGVVEHALEIYDHGSLIADDPGVMTARQQRHVAGPAIEFGAVVHFDPEHAGHVILEMWGFAAPRLGDRLHRRNPSPTRLENGAPDRGAPDLDQLQPAFWKFA